ncbi:MAG: VOC family protein [Rhodospirillaceae bacterium]|jgi:catechol 2,3-dioxygenase-like lactoylglutathione lyase family enzyme|nr:VOC family protein [Rhodospirillaceae bacterium]MBT4590282.1 VOC family protein [Rhodospirillaceae bacterium]MBT4939252.1 VOC family protein [Rhodospirillaceae bacterium]MBT7265930.1 VOC family protein [Rhodospirillaceae bacterium]
MDQALKKEPLLKLNFLSHGTVECADLTESRRFYEEVLGLEVVQTSKVSFQMRLNSSTTIVCVQTNGDVSAGIFSHFGFDLETEEEVNAAHEKVAAVKDDYGIKKLTRPGLQHNVYSFYIVDLDGNWWEVLKNPKGGYGHLFEKGENQTSWGEQKKDQVEAIIEEG